MRAVDGGNELLEAAAEYAKSQCVEFNLNAGCFPDSIGVGNYQCLSQKRGSAAQFVHIDLGGEGIQVRLSVFTWCCMRARLRTVSYVGMCQLLVFLHL